MSSGSLFHSRRHSWPASDYVSKSTLHLLESGPGAPPEPAWRRRLNSHANILKEFSVTFREALKMLHLGFRLWSYVQEERSQGRTAPINPFTREIRASACHGVPLGGMGGGSIGRGFRGEFRRWQLIPGVCEEAPVLANQFSAFISRDSGKKKFSSVLYPGRPADLGKADDSGISSWDWVLDGQRSTYHAVFPRAWTVYEGEPDPDLKISCRQVSPFIPNNYKESSFPSCVFSYTIVNTGRDSATVSLLFTWANSIGGMSHMSGGHFNESFKEEAGVRGILLHHKTAKGYPPVTFAIAAKKSNDVSVSVCPSFSLSGKSTGCTAKAVWLAMKEHGNLEEMQAEGALCSPSSAGESIAGAVAASVVVQPREKKTITFSLAWDSPEVKFLKGRSYYRRYTQFYGRLKNAAARLVHDALHDYQKWEAEIERWQNPILKDGRLPEWYRFTLFNELYYLVAGGTIWTDGVPALQMQGSNINGNDRNVVEAHEVDENDEKNNSGNAERNDGTVSEVVYDKSSVLDKQSAEDEQSVFREKELAPNNETDCSVSGVPPVWNVEKDVGRFLYLEGVEYTMWCTYDVHFYASFALLALFPKLELSMQKEFAAATMQQNSERTKFLAGGNWGIRKVLGAVPHDLGTHDPWLEVNAYNIHDTSKWKDLNSKFVLQVYRDFAATGDVEFAKKVWPAVYAAMAYMDQFDRDRDGLIENDGFPDQTYDTWTVHGISAYSGGLWIAALQAAAAMAQKLNHKNAAGSFTKKFYQAREVYEKRLWNGTYFNYDSGASSNSNSIQADQLAGQWYAWASGLPCIFEKSKIDSALQKIYDFNVMKVKGGKLGAVNGMHPNGKVDETCMQSREIWTGVTYSVAATMIHAGMMEQAFKTAEGIFHAGWSDDGYGYWFQTPEGWTTDGHFRSLTYMRPLAIWAMQWAINPPKPILDAPKIPTMEKESSSYFHTVAEALGNVPRPQLEDIQDCCSRLHNCICKGQAKE